LTCSDGSTGPAHNQDGLTPETLISRFTFFSRVNSFDRLIQRQRIYSRHPHCAVEPICGFAAEEVEVAA
jgi:hypothetical protein